MPSYEPTSLIPRIQWLIDEQTRALQGRIGRPVSVDSHDAAKHLAVALNQRDPNAAQHVVSLWWPRTSPPDGWWDTPLGKAVQRALPAPPERDRRWGLANDPDRVADQLNRLFAWIALAFGAFAVFVAKPEGKLVDPHAGVRTGSEVIYIIAVLVGLLFVVRPPAPGKRWHSSTDRIVGWFGVGFSALALALIEPNAKTVGWIFAGLAGLSLVAAVRTRLP